MSEYAPQGFRMLPPVVKNLIIINFIVFLATMVLEKYNYNGITTATYFSTCLPYGCSATYWRITGVRAGFSFTIWFVA